MGDALFEHVLALHGDRPMRSVLDAGTGRHSLAWVKSLPTERWTAVTGDAEMAETVGELCGDARPEDRVVLGNWSDPALLSGETFDVVLADYLLGALDAFAPYYQDLLFERLRPHVGGRLYVIGLEPLLAPNLDGARCVPERPDSAIVREIARARDATLLLCDERCYREHPATWIRRHLERAGYRVVSERAFANVLRGRWIDGQIDMCVRRLGRLPGAALGVAYGSYLEDLRARAHACCEAMGGLRSGHDHVIAAEPR